MRTVYYKGLVNNGPLGDQPSQTEDISKWIKERCTRFGTQPADYFVSETTIINGPTTLANPKQANGDKKVKVQYIPPSAIIALGEALGEGGVKYGPFNWRDKPVEVLTYVGGMLRHLLAYMDGEDVDPEGGKLHLGGLMANAAILVDATHCGTIIDNRPKKGHSGDRIRELAGVKL
jgi:hypothetical protein